MRYVVIGFCVFTGACAGTSPAAPTSSVSQIVRGMATTQATGGSELPFKGTYEGLETVVTVTSHHLDATGNATQLGQFTVAADWTVGTGGGIGTSTWTAANGDAFSTSFTRHGVVVPPTITFTETHTITPGTGRFANASGIFTVVQTRGVSMPYNNAATIDGTINLGHRSHWTLRADAAARCSRSAASADGTRRRSGCVETRVIAAGRTPPWLAPESERPSRRPSSG
jgi:hypothetical protein